jgi:microcystin-dependent protein
MAQKKITDLSLRSDFDATVNLPGDDASQTWRVTGAQIKTWLKSEFSDLFVPTGAVLPFAGSTAPDGFLLCDGSAVSRSTYSALYTAIGVAHGYGDNSTTFNLPDYRGRFLRGRDGGTAVDPNAATRTAMNTGGATGDAVGSIQADDYKSHAHNIGVRNGGDGAGSKARSTTDGASSATAATELSGGSETRPKNAYVNYVIKT